MRPEWRTWSFWLGPICTACYALFVLLGLPYLVYQSVQNGFTKEEQLVFIGGLFVLVSLPMSIWLIRQHLKHFNRPNLQKPIIRILWMIPIYGCNAWLALVVPGGTIYLDSIRECYEAYVIYNFMIYLLEALCMEMDLLAVMHSKPQTKHFFPFCLLRSWDMGTEFVYKCKHGILQYAFFQPIITVISVICELCGVYSKGTIAIDVAYPYLVVVTNISQTVAMYCLVLFYRATKDDMGSMRPLSKFLCIKAVIFFSFFQGMIINILVYFKVIKNIFGTNEQDDYQVLSEKLQNFLLCIEMLLATIAHHYSYSYQEHQINIPNYRPASNNFREMFDVKDIMQDVQEHIGAVKNSLLRPFRSADPFQESKTLLRSRRESAFGSSRSGANLEAVPGPSRYGTVNYVSTHSMIPIAPHSSQSHPLINHHHQQQHQPYHHQGAAPPAEQIEFGNVFGRGGGGGVGGQQTEGSSSSGAAAAGPSVRLVDSSPTATRTTSKSQTIRKSDSDNTNSWPSNSLSDDVMNIEVKGPEQNLIQLPSTPKL